MKAALAVSGFILALIGVVHAITQTALHPAYLILLIAPIAGHFQDQRGGA